MPLISNVVARRYFVSVRYVVSGTEHTIQNWGPHAIAPQLGSLVTVRYRTTEPGTAVVWQRVTHGRIVLLALATIICALAEVLALKALFE